MKVSSLVERFHLRAPSCKLVSCTDQCDRCSCHKLYSRWDFILSSHVIKMTNVTLAINYCESRYEFNFSTYKNSSRRFWLCKMLILWFAIPIKDGRGIRSLPIVQQLLWHLNFFPALDKLPHQLRLIPSFLFPLLRFFKLSSSIWHTTAE